MRLGQRGAALEHAEEVMKADLRIVKGKKDRHTALRYIAYILLI